MVESSAVFESECKVSLAPCWWLFSVSFQELLSVILQPTVLSSSSASSSQIVTQTCQTQELPPFTETIPSYQCFSVYLINTRKFLTK
jgi:hypothetical protein